MSYEDLVIFLEGKLPMVRESIKKLGGYIASEELSSIDSSSPGGCPMLSLKIAFTDFCKEPK